MATTEGLATTSASHLRDLPLPILPFLKCAESWMYTHSFSSGDQKSACSLSQGFPCRDTFTILFLPTP